MIPLLAISLYLLQEAISDQSYCMRLNATLG